jgi:hypothetical protein
VLGYLVFDQDDKFKDGHDRSIEVNCERSECSIPRSKFQATKENSLFIGIQDLKMVLVR